MSDPLKVWKDGHLVLAAKEIPTGKPQNTNSQNIKFSNGHIVDQRQRGLNAAELYAAKVLDQSIDEAIRTGKGARTMQRDSGSTGTSRKTQHHSLLARHGLQLTWLNGHIVEVSQGLYLGLYLGLGLRLISFHKVLKA